MLKLYKNKYRIPSARHPKWNYKNTASYFVTILAKDRKHFFGRIQNGYMSLNSVGTIAYSEWKATTELRPDMNLTLGEFIIMPNHFHAIVTIGNNIFNTSSTSALQCTSNLGPHQAKRKDALQCVSDLEPQKAMPLKQPCTSQFGPQRKNLSSIIRGFKSSVTRKTRKINPDFEWHPRFHDHIIRNERAYNNISNYITNNPQKWTNKKHQ